MQNRIWFYHITLLLSMVFIIEILKAQVPIFSFENPPFEAPNSKSRINTIHQSLDGCIWLGTTSGVLKFDGCKYTTFSYNPLDKSSLSNTWITEIIETPNSHLLVATPNDRGL